MRWLFVLAAAMSANSPVLAQEAKLPAVKPHDTWVYRSTTEEGKGWHQTRTEVAALRAGPAGNLVSIKEAGSTNTPVEQLSSSDWARTRSINGHDTTVSRPFAFPMTPGKTWAVDFSEINPNREHSKEHIHINYTVVGWENVTVPAGTFNKALKIEGDGMWTADAAAAINGGSATRVDGSGATIVTRTNKVAPRTFEGKLYRAYWYVPEVKRWVKLVEETYSSTGARVKRETAELESSKMAE